MEDLLVYDNPIVEGHSLYRLCGSTLNTVSNRDYRNRDYFDPEIKCLDMDTYEKNILQKSHADKTVDAVIGIGTFHHNRVEKHRLLLIELRIDYGSIRNLSITDMERKVRYTKGELGGEKSINEETFFIFNDNVTPQARNLFERLSETNAYVRKWLACSVSQFRQNVLSPRNLPYTPINKRCDIEKSIQAFCADSDSDKYLKQIRYWCNEAVRYRYSNTFEYNHIKAVVKESWKLFKEKTTLYDDNIELECEILEEDFGNLLN